MQGLAGLLFPVLLMLFALVMEKFERTVTAQPRAADTVDPETADEGPTVETLAGIGLPSAVEQLDLDRRAAHRRAS
jgi:hypothetical protein